MAECTACQKSFDTEAALADHMRGKHELARSQISFAEKQGGICFWCERPVLLAVDRNHPAAPTREHLIPRALNGSKAVANIVLAHRRCNELRGHMDADAFARLMRGEAVTKFDLWPHLFCRGIDG